MDCKHTSDVTKRLSRIAGQVNGIKDMVENNRECEDILMQLSSISGAISQVARIIMTEHLEHCVVSGIKSGDEDATIANLKKAVEQFSKMK